MAGMVTDEHLSAYTRYEHALFSRMCDGELSVDKVLKSLLDLIDDNFGAIPIGSRRLIDCNASPFIPEYVKVECHRKGGMIEFSDAGVILHLEKKQKIECINSDKLREALDGKPTLNACVLDHLLANTSLIPESWKVDKNGYPLFIIFWGTIYRDCRGELCVRLLLFMDGQWCWRYHYFKHSVSPQHPAAIRVS
jgi:hypothetical protein